MAADELIIRGASDVAKLEPFETKEYDDLALTSLTAYSIFWLDTWEIATSLENIAVVSHRMFPAKFCMVGWPQFPDPNRTNRSILQMRPKYRNLATSASDKGVFLNEGGIREATALIRKLGPPRLSGGKLVRNMEVVPASRGRGKARSLHPEDAMSKLRKTRLFALYNANQFDSAEAIHLIGMLEVYDHTPSKEKRRKLKQLLDQAKSLNDVEAQEFLRALQEKFIRYLNR